MTSEKHVARSLAILNPQPQLLPGPNLLHEFALKCHKDASTVKLPAIGYLDGDASTQTLSYADLDSRSDRLASLLLFRFGELGILDTDRIIVPVFIPQCLELYVSLLAILKAGAAFCPQALDAPVDRLRFVFGDVNATVVLTTTAHREALPAVDGIQVFCVDQIFDVDLSAVNHTRAATPQHPAYVLYTSGSTGTPKGVVLSHRAVTQSLLAHDSVIPHFERFLQFASPTFDVSMFEIFFTLYRGATLIACDRRKLLDDLPGVLNHMQVDAAELTPTVAGSLLGSRDQVPGLKVLLTIGEMLTRHVIDEFGAAADRTGLLQGMYGPTEAAIHCTLQANFKADASPGIIGSPLSTVSAFVIAVPADCGDDPTRIKVLQVGEVGELAVGGHQLADGYLNREEQTKTAFISTENYGMLYRTGDKARLREDGVLECLGRISSGQIKLRGMRMELGEIEHAAATAKGCRVTIASVLNQNLVVFCLTDEQVTQESVLTACRKWLPSYMMPNEVVLRRSLPQLPSGKVDKKKLEAEYLESSQDEPQRNPQSLSAEEEAGSEVLHTVFGSSFSLDTKLAHNGMDSLSAIRVASLLRQKGYDVDAIKVLGSRTLKALAITLEKHRAQPRPSNEQSPSDRHEALRAKSLALPLLQGCRDKVKHILPCSPLQSSMLAETRHQSGAYCNWIELFAEVHITIAQIRDALLASFRQNDILRSGFVIVDDDAFSFAQVVFDTKTLPEMTETGKFSYNFDMTTDEDYLKPLRVQLQDHADGPQILLQIHHALYDGWSVDLFISDINAFLNAKQDPDRERPQFSQVLHYYGGLDSHTQEPAMQYWKSMLRGYQAVSIPKLRCDQSPEIQLSVLRHQFNLNWADLRSHMPKGHHPQTLFQGAVSYLLSCYLGTSDVVLGSVTSGRTIPVAGIEEIIGPCIATLPLRVAIDQQTSSRRLMQAIAASNRAMLEHCTLPLQQIKSLAGIKPGQPFFDVLFIWQESLQSHKALESKVKVIDSRDHLEFNLVVEVEPHQDHMNLTLRYRESLWPARQAELFMMQIEAVATRMLAEPATQIMDLSGSVPNSALSSDASAAMSREQNEAVELDVPVNAQPLVIRRTGTTCQVVPRGALGEIFFVTADPYGKRTEKNVLGGFGTLTSTKHMGRMLSDSSVITVTPSKRSKTNDVSREDLELIETAAKDFRHVEVAMATTIASEGGLPQVVVFWSLKDISSDSLAVLELNSRTKAIMGRLYDHLLARLPPHLVPSALVPIKGLHTSQQIEQLHTLFMDLSEPYRQSLQYGQIAEQADDEWSDLELAIADATARIAGIASADIKLRTSFFNIGINSITAISLARALNRSIDAHVESADVLRNPSVLGLAAFLERKQALPTFTSLDLSTAFGEDVKGDITGRLAQNGLKYSKILPCTPLQEAMLAAEMSGGQQAYQNHTLFSVQCSLSKMQSALQEVCSRHEILRTCFFATEDKEYAFVQVVLADIEAPIKLLSSGISDHVKANIKAVDTTTLPYSIVLQEGDEPKLLLSMHHALYDGKAIDVLLNEIEELCFQKTLPEAPFFDDFLSHALNLDTATADLFWDKQLKDFVCTPLYRLGDESTKSTTRISSLPLDQDFSSVEAAATRCDSTPLALLQAAWAATLSSLVDEIDVCFGNVVSGRTMLIDGIDRLVAPCFNTIPVRIDLSKPKSSIDLIRTLHDINSDSLEFQFTPLRHIQARWSSDGERLFETLFLLQSPPRTLDERVWTLEQDLGDMGFPIVCELVPQRGSSQIDLKLHYNESILPSQRAEELSYLYGMHLRNIVERQDQTFRATDLVPDLVRTIQIAKQAFLKTLHASIGNVSLEGLPRSPSGLVSRSTVVKKYVRPKNSTTRTGSGVGDEDFDENEATIRSVLARFTRVPEKEISKHRTIFQLGLDSVSAIQVAKALRSHGCAVNAEDILAYPSIDALNQALKHGSIGAGSESPIFDFDTFENFYRSAVCETTACDVEHIKSIMPCTALQAGIIAQFQHTRGDAYFNHWTFELDVNIKLDQLRVAWNTVAEHHDMLRTGFVNIDSHEHPFAAVCYHDVPKDNFQVLAYTIDSEAIRTQMLESVQSHLHTPVWRSWISKSNNKHLMHFSALHAIFDAKSLDIFFKDLWSAYQGRKSDLSVRGNMRSLLSTILTGAKDQDGTHKKFWSEHISNGTPTRFPSLTPERSAARRHVQKSIRTSACKRSLVQQACQSQGVTLQAALQSAFAILLSTYIGNPGVNFGVVLSGRTSDEANEIAFPAAVTLPFHADYYENPQELLRQAMAFNGSVRKHQFTPLTDTQRWAGVGKTSLFDCLLVLQEESQYRSDGFVLVDEQGTVEYSLSLEVTSGHLDVLELSLVFWDDVIPKPHAELFLRQFDQTLAELLHLDIPSLDDGCLSAQLPLHEILDTDVTFMHEFVERSCSDIPQKPALEFNWNLSIERSRKTWTYADLDAQGNKMANYLLEHNHRPGSIIAICFDKCPEASFATYGILKAGSGFVAIDHGAPIARKKFIAQDSKASAVLTMSSLAKELQEELSIPIIALDEVDMSSQSSEKPIIEDQISNQSTCYCLYTSGSTGTPKGCLISHYNAVQGLLAFKLIFDGRYTANSRWLQFASFHFDVSVLEQFWSWMVGICVVSAPRDVIFEDLAGALNTLEITHLDLTPSLARLITPEQIPSLCDGVFITGGEQLRQEVLDAWGETGVIHNFYGPSECTIGVTVNPGVGRNGKTSNIGHQFANVGSFVFKPDTVELVLKGAPGELCISGPLVGKGYLNRPELTEERFPYVEAIGQRIYRTGDLVRVLHDGSFDFLGRIDDQVKLRGQRLELGEINNAVRESSKDVKDSHTMVIKDKHRQTEQVVAFVVFDSSQTSDMESTRKVILERCKSQLPVYMVPSQIVGIDNALPLTPNNKVDIKALRSHFDRAARPETSHTDGETPSKPLANVTEHNVAAVFAEYLKIDKSGISGSTNIFQAGLDSISVFSFVRALRSKGFLAASTQIVMKSNNIADLAQQLDSNDLPSQDGHVIEAKQALTACLHRYRSQAAQELDVTRDRIETLAPCTPLQQGMIAKSLESAKDGRGLYFTSFVFDLSADVVLETLRDAWWHIIQKIPILRTEFVETSEGHIQVVLTPTGQMLNDMILIDHDEPSDSVLVKPLRIMLEKDRMTLQISHALYDATSLQLILDSLASAYHGNDLFKPGPSFFEALPHGPLRKSEESKAFWVNHLRDARLSLLHESIGPTKEKIASSTSQLTGLENFDKLRRSFRVTHQAMVQACWSAVLQSHLGTATTIGMVVSGRSIDFEGADRVIGPMFNTLPFYAGLNKDDTFASAAKRCHIYNIETLPHQHTSLSDISKWTHKQGRRSLFDTLFVFQKAQETFSNKPPNPWIQVHGRAAADFPLAFEVEQNSDQALSINVVALASMAGRNLSDILMKSFIHAMEAFLKDPHAPISQTLGQAFIDSCVHEDTAVKTMPEDSGSAEKHHDWDSESFANSTIGREVAALAGIEITSVTPATSIFELGLDSIDAIKLSSRLKEAKIQLPVSSIMRAQTIAAMAEMSQHTTHDGDIDKSQDGHYDRLLSELDTYVRQTISDHSTIESVLPVTPLQEAMIAEMYTTDCEHYFNHDILALPSHTNAERLKAAWQTVVSSSPILRTSFVEIEDPNISGTFAQIIHSDNHGFWVPSSITTADSEHEIFQQYYTEHRKSVLADRQSPPWRITSFQTSQGFYLILSISHALYDGFSLGLLHEDVKMAYHGRTVERSTYEPVLRNVIQASGLEAERFWADSLEGVQPCEFGKREQGTNTEQKKIFHKEVLSKSTSASVNTFCKQQRITPQALAYTCWSFVLATYASNLDTVCGLVLAGRDDEVSQQVLFPTMNTVAMRSVIHGSHAEMLQYSQSSLAGVTQYQHFPLRKVQALVGSDSLFNSLFIYQKRSSSPESCEEPIYESRGGDSSVDYPVAVEIELLNDQVFWRVACSDSHLSESGTELLLSQLDEVLRRIMDKPGATTISHDNNGTSVCGLPSFRPNITSRSSVAVPDEGYSSDRGSLTPKERSVCEVLATVSRVSITDIAKDHTLFHLGLDSISAIKVSSLLRNQKGLKISVSEMLRAGNVEQIAGAAIIIDQTEDQNERGQEDRYIIRNYLDDVDLSQAIQKVGVPSTDVEDVLPATAGQVYTLCMSLNSNGYCFWPTFKYRLHGVTSTAAVESAWQNIVTATPILRTSFVATENDGVPFLQIVLKPDAIVRAKIRPMVLLQTSQGESYIDISLRVHHAMYDAVSLELVTQELLALCVKPDSKPSWTPDRCSLTPFIASAGNQGASIETPEGFYESYLKGHQSETKSRCEPSFLPWTAVYKPGLLSRPASEKLLSCARSTGLSVQSIFLAAFTKVQASRKEIKNGSNMVIGVYLANRSTEETASLPAPTLNFLPVLARSPGSVTVTTLARQMQHDMQAINASSAGSHAPLWKIKQKTGIKVDAFVNFLPLVADEDDTKTSQSKKIILESLDVDSSEVDKTVQGLSAEDEACLAALRGTGAAQSYTPCFDVEAAIRPGRGLDVGVFGPEGVIGREAAEQVIAELKKVLEELIAGS